jgi:hypothetical protein
MPAQATLAALTEIARSLENMEKTLNKIWERVNDKKKK